MNRRDQERIVAVARDPRATGYPEAPFSPPEAYPELKGSQGTEALDPANGVYRLVRECLEQLGLDASHAHTPEWNPFRDLIQPGGKVVIKPNLVYHDHPLGRAGVLSMVTHAAVIRPIVDYVLRATGGAAEITVCDAPLQSADFTALRRIAGYDSLLEHYRSLGVNLRMVDLRQDIAVIDNEGLIVRHDPGTKDPKGYRVADLGAGSAFHPIRGQAHRLEITDYPPGSVARHHRHDRNEYLIGASILDADLFINVPKLKTHKKAGITGALKNLIGIIGDKSWIAHHRRGGRRAGGDEYDRLRPFEYALWHFNAALKRSAAGIAVNRVLRKAYRRTVLGGKSHKRAVLEGGGALMIMEGSWIGNDTLWRTVLDLNRIALFADREGRVRDDLQRHYLAIGDAVIAGEKNGPMEQMPRPAGMILGAFNPVTLDCVAAALMGFNPHSLPQIRHGFENEFFPLCPATPAEIEVRANFELDEAGLEPFIPPHGWESMVAPPDSRISNRIAGRIGTRAETPVA